MKNQLIPFKTADRYQRSIYDSHKIIKIGKHAVAQPQHGTQHRVANHNMCICDCNIFKNSRLSWEHAC